MDDMISEINKGCHTHTQKPALVEIDKFLSICFFCYSNCPDQFINPRSYIWIDGSYSSLKYLRNTNERLLVNISFFYLSETKNIYSILI